jgi:DNA repair protein RecO (recombination protein O)
MARRLAHARVDTSALLVAKNPLGEADVMVKLFTESHGMVSAVARNALRSQKRFPALEPMHLLRVRLELSPLREVATLAEAALERPRIGLTTRLSTLEAAGRALRWLRRAAPARHAEPELWATLNGLLDALDAIGPQADGVPAMLATAGLQLLGAAGWALELGRCVRCGKPCPERAPSVLEVAAGGIVCRACGGRGRVLSAAERRALLASAEGDGSALSGLGAERALAIVDEAIEVHARGEAT